MESNPHRHFLHVHVHECIAKKQIFTPVSLHSMHAQQKIGSIECMLCLHQIYESLNLRTANHTNDKKDDLFVHPYTHTHPPPIAQTTFDFDPTLLLERQICWSQCISPSSSPHPPPSAPTFFPDHPSSLSNCWLSPAVLQSAWENSLPVGEKFIHPTQTK